MKTYRKILIPSIATCPAAAQLARGAEVAAAGDSAVRVVQFIDSRTGFEADGPAGTLPLEKAARRVPAARRRLELTLARSPLGWAKSSVIHGEPDRLLANVLRAWQPDLVIVTSGWSRSRWVEQAAREACIAVPDILSVEGDGVLTRLLRTILRHAAADADPLVSSR